MISSELKDVMKRLTILNENNKGVLIGEEKYQRYRQYDKYLSKKI